MGSQPSRRLKAFRRNRKLASALEIYGYIILYCKYDFFLSLLHLSADKPICRSEQKRIYGVARNEAAEILCEVDAFPPPESFKWSFNNTAETFEMPQSDYRIHSSQASTLSYTPVKVSCGVWGGCSVSGSGRRRRWCSSSKV